MKEENRIILEKLAAGDEQFYRAVFMEYYPPLTYYAFKRIQDMEAAREIVQELFVRIYEKRFNLTIESSFKSYLYKAVHNSCINHLHSKHTREGHHQNILKEREGESVLSIEESITQTEFEHRVYSEIEKLPEQCRRIFKMNRFEGISNGKIAEILGLSKRTVETQISKALKIMREKLADI